MKIAYLIVGMMLIISFIAGCVVINQPSEPPAEETLDPLDDEVMQEIDNLYIEETDLDVGSIIE